MTPDKTLLSEMYHRMRRIRRFEETAQELYRRGTVVGLLHLYIGEEAVAAGACLALADDDYITSTHRGHGHVLAKGADANRLLAELCGRVTGYCQGKGGSMHAADLSLGILGANGIVGGGFGIATGAALSAKKRRSGQVTICFFGDGAANRGPFLEGLNWAQVYQLPVLFVCEDNRISATTPTGPMTAGEGVSARAQAMGMKALKVDGNDAQAVDVAAAALIAEIRAGRGPRLLHAVTYRFKGHVSVDPGTYRDAAEVEAAKGNDPLGVTRRQLLAAGAAVAELDTIDQAAVHEIARAMEAAEAAPWPEASAAYEEVMNSGAGVWR